ncbi:hypothetical protein WJX73_009424 [Symbiochloris irregularis]|uniref:Uncharacterized protein n=1 Tax=Symbiochloris irregularis TaxID=706552 RepID=A0AAW1P3E6_9CHLO
MEVVEVVPQFVEVYWQSSKQVHHACGRKFRYRDILDLQLRRWAWSSRHDRYHSDHHEAGTPVDLLPGSGLVAPNNEALATFAKHALQRGQAGEDPLLPQSNNYEGFIKELKASIDSHPLPARTIDVLFGNFESIHPACNGDWMEFGVWRGTSINKTADYRAKHCSPSCPPVFGFDTFTGLPEAWVGDDKQQSVWAAESTGRLSSGAYGRGRQENHAPLSYIHIDCDLFAGARDALTLLSHKIVPGTVILFDELINYNRFKDNELKALWMWLRETGAKLATIGTWGPLPDVPGATMDLNMAEGHELERQSAAFLVVTKAGSSTAMWN